MNNEGIDNKCMKCKYGVKEYVKITGAFIPVRCIDCTCAVLNTRESKKRIKNKVQCLYYEYDEIENNPLERIIGYKLVKMADEINEIAKILKRMNKTDEE